MVALIHIHDLAWWSGVPDVKVLLSASRDSEVFDVVETINTYADSLVSTINPAISLNGSNTESSAPQGQTLMCATCPTPRLRTSHSDLVDLIATWPATYMVLCGILLEEAKGEAARNVGLTFQSLCKL